MSKLISPNVLLGERRLPEIGKIKIGGLGQKRKSTAGKEFRMPVKFDHFRVTRRARTSEGNFEVDREVHDALGTEKPQHLDIRLPFAKTEQNLHTEYVVYKGRQKTWSCDGEEATNLKTGSCGPCQMAGGCKCKPYTRLSVILEAAPTFGGVYVFRSTSIETAANLQGNLMMFEREFESLAGLELRLVLLESEDQLEDGGTSTSWKVAVVLRSDYAEAAERALEYRSRHQLAHKKLQLLAAGTDEGLDQVDAEEAEFIEEEFFPEGEELTLENDVASANSQDAMDRLKGQLGIQDGPDDEPEEAEYVVVDVDESDSSDDGPPADIWVLLSDLRKEAERKGRLMQEEISELDQCLYKGEDAEAEKWVIYLKERLQ